ncbi:MAG: hypothetical protein P8J20_18235 [Novosphingobium sp.]|nr:hypothetical protein [Novosphingobium sp.]
MNSITIDGMEEMEFRRSIEGLLRQGQADDAADRLKTLLKGYAGEGRLLPERFLTVSANDISLEGWDQLGEKLGEYDRAEMAMSAISVDILDPQGVGARPDESGRLRPVIETSYFSDSAYPFSEADRDDLLDGYSSFGCEWQGNFENIDTTIAVEGIDDLYGVTVGLENKVASSAKFDSEDVEAGALGSCYLAVLIHQAIRDAAAEKGLPRPLCVLAGSNDAYPFFDAAAMTVGEYCQDGRAELPGEALADEEFGDEFAEDALESAAPGGMASLESMLGIGGSKKEKKPVLMIDPDEADTIEKLELPLEMALEMPLPVAAESEEREHIMPSVDLGAVAPTEEVELPPELPVEPQAPDNREESPEVWEQIEPTEPLNFSVENVPAPSGLDAGEPAPPAAFEPQQPPAPLELDAFKLPKPADHNVELPAAHIDNIPAEPPVPVDREVEQEPTPIEFGAYERQPPAEDAPQEPLVPFDRLNPDEEELSHERPLLPEEPPAPLHRLASDDFGGDTETPFELDQSMQAEEPAPEPWTAEFDTPARDGYGDEPGDNLPWPEPPAERHDEPLWEEPKPARHSIRVIAASVTNEGNGRSRRAVTGNGSQLPRWMTWIGSALVWLYKRIARR